MMYIARVIIEDRIVNLTKKRDEALRRKDYDRAWKLNMKIENNMTRMINCSYFKIWA